MNRTLVLLALSCFMVGAYAASQQVYKWTDASGVVHFSDAPPPKDSKDVQLMKVSSDDRPHSVDNPPNRDAGNNSATDAKDSTASAAPDDPKNADAKACANARNNLEVLNSKIQISMTGPDGKPKVLDDKGRQEQIAFANAQITLYCKP